MIEEFAGADGERCERPLLEELPILTFYCLDGTVCLRQPSSRVQTKSPVQGTKLIRYAAELVFRRWLPPTAPVLPVL